MPPPLSELLSATRTGVFRSRPVYVPYASTSGGELESLETTLGVRLPAEFRNWLITAGYGDIDDRLSFRKAWFSLLVDGPLQGCVVFAQDILGNFYAFDPAGAVYVLLRTEPSFGVMSVSFADFVGELIKRSFDLEAWVDMLALQHHDPGAVT